MKTWLDSLGTISRFNRYSWYAGMLLVGRVGIAAYFVTHALTTRHSPLAFVDYLVAGWLGAGFYTRIIAGLRGSLLLWETVASAPFTAMLGTESAFDYPLPLVAALACLLLFLTGAGRFSVDWIFFQPGKWPR